MQRAWIVLRQKLMGGRMFRYAVVTGRPDRFAVLVQTFTRLAAGSDAAWHRNGALALKAAAASPVDLMIIDEDLEDYAALEVVRRLMAVSAAINTAVVSSLPPQQFHEWAEGLGVLAQLPPFPDEANAESLIARLRSLRL